MDTLPVLAVDLHVQAARLAGLVGLLPGFDLDREGVGVIHHHQARVAHIRAALQHFVSVQFQLAVQVGGQVDGYLRLPIFDIHTARADGLALANDIEVYGALRLRGEQGQIHCLAYFIDGFIRAQ